MDYDETEVRNRSFLILAPDLPIDTDDSHDDMDVCDDSSEHEVHSPTLVDTPGVLARLEGHGTDPRDSGQRGRGAQPLRAGPDSAPWGAFWPATSESASGPRGRHPVDPRSQGRRATGFQRVNG